MTMILGYWDTRGLGQHIRLLLEYTGDKYEEKQYVCGEAPDYDKSQWTDVKFKLGMDFPNLPYLVDGNRKIPQSNAIMRYIARKHNMCGETEDEKIRVDVLENQAMDLRLAFIKLTYLNIITFVDFVMYELLDEHRALEPKCLENFKNLNDLMKRFEALERIAAYMKSPRFMKGPINNRMAQWGK
uniref:glutathione transferase n=1 Tax=Haplochromis burtoni TaxID=8153 RepID=A0A3Q2XFU8_HAPBU